MEEKEKSKSLSLAPLFFLFFHAIFGPSDMITNEQTAASSVGHVRPSNERPPLIGGSDQTETRPPLAWVCLTALSSRKITYQGNNVLIYQNYFTFEEMDIL